MIQISHDFDAVGFYPMNNDTAYEGVSVIRRDYCEQKTKEEDTKGKGTLPAVFGGRSFMFWDGRDIYAGGKCISVNGT